MRRTQLEFTYFCRTEYLQATAIFINQLNTNQILSYEQNEEPEAKEPELPAIAKNEI